MFKSVNKTTERGHLCACLNINISKTRRGSKDVTALVSGERPGPGTGPTEASRSGIPG